MTACLVTSLESPKFWFHQRKWYYLTNAPGLLSSSTKITFMFPILSKKRQSPTYKSLQKRPWDWVLPRNGSIFPPAKPCLLDPRPPKLAGSEPRVRAPWPRPHRGAEPDTAFLELWRAAATSAPGGGSRARGRGRAAPPLAPPPRPYSVGRPRALPALCSAAAGAPVCADLEGGGRSSSLLPRGIPSALQPLARRSLSRSPSPSRGPGAAPVSCRECAGARGEAVGRGRPGRVQLRAAARRRGRAPETGELSVRVLLAGAAASDPRPPGCTLGCHPPLLVCLRCRWLTRTRGVHDPRRPRGS